MAVINRKIFRGSFLWIRDISAIKLFYWSLIEYPLLLILPVSSGYELAFAFIPFLFGLLGCFFAIIYWLAKKLKRGDAPLLYYTLLSIIICWQVFTALDMAFDLI